MSSAFRSKRWLFAAVCAGLSLQGCASTRGGQDISCDDFAKYARTPDPSSFVRDIQRYGAQSKSAQSETPQVAQLETLGAPPPDPSPPSMDDVLQSVAFGNTSDAALKAEGERIQQEYEAKKRESSQAVGLESLGGESGGGVDEIVVKARIPSRNLLLLSGGGQWGAYGAGLFLGLACPKEKASLTDRDAMPCVSVKNVDGKKRIVIDQNTLDFTKLNKMKVGFITGVSTGGLQSILLMVVLDQTQPETTRTAALEQLLNSYAPESESDLVDNDGFTAVLFKGSVAGTDALRSHVKTVLEGTYDFASTDGEGTVEKRLVDHIADSPIEAMVGIVEGYDGQFKYVNMKHMVSALRKAGAPPEAPTQCVLATTLASSAMPVFHQQLRVVKADGPDQDTDPDIRTLFDGGVRRSVFVSNIAEKYGKGIDKITKQLDREALEATIRSETLPKIYVLRNGPTTAKVDKKVDAVDGAINQAMRAYSLLVNELEVSSIASLRLINPYGPIEISTADGSLSDEIQHDDGPADPRKACTKKDEMFKPSFMRCLQNFGARRGMGLERDSDKNPIEGFWKLSTVPLPPKSSTGEP